MNIQKRCYAVTVKLDRFYRVRGATVRFTADGFIAEKFVHAEDRDRAVYLSLQWYWEYLTGKTGPVYTVLTVDDPYGEVSYTPDFSCVVRKNNYLPDDIIERVIKESGGVLKKNTPKGRPHHPSNALARVKRRRTLPHWIAPSIYADENNTFFFYMTTRSQLSRNGKIVRHRKMSMKRLTAKNIPDAAKEIVERGLFAEHMKQRGYPRNNGLISLLKRYAFKQFPVPVVAA